MSRGLKVIQSVYKKTVRGNQNLTASLQTVHQAPIHYDYRHLQMTKNLVLKGQNYDAKVVLSQEAKKDLDWWSNNLKEFNGKNIVLNQGSVVIQTDATSLGWGPVCQNTK
jgi:hypothetical protein